MFPRAADDAVESGTPQTPTERPLPTKRRKQSAKELAENNPYVLQAFQRQLQQREQEKEQLEEQHARLRSAKQEQLQERQQRAEAAANSGQRLRHPRKRRRPPFGPVA